MAVGDLSSQQLGMAFGFVAIAGACTGIGGLLAITIRRMDRRVLAGALGLAAGAMVWITIGEIFQNSIGHFTAGGASPANAYTFASLSCLAGIPIVLLLDLLVHAIMHIASRRSAARAAQLELQQQTSPPDASEQDIESEPPGLRACDTQTYTTLSGTVTTQDTSGLQKQGQPQVALTLSADENSGACAPPQKNRTALGILVLASDEMKMLLHTSILTGLALALHNLPEGLATFTSYVSDEMTGVAVLIGIAVHNIPEGIVVAVPIFYATGSRWRAVMWALLTGLAEPLGALIGLAVVYGGGMTETAMGVIMGVVGGIMVSIAVRELVPNALAFDPSGKVVSWSILAGMGVMAASLIVLGYVS